MKVIGLIGGMSWESSLEYYRLINELVKERLGGYHSARCVLYSVDFEEIEECQRAGRWAEAAEILVEAARGVEKAGADLLVICTNTMHRMAGEVQQALRIPLLHIADATAEKVIEKGIKKIGLLGTKYTMEQDFYTGRLKAHGLEVVIPDEPDREVVHRIIYDELVKGKVLNSSREKYKDIINRLAANGAEGIILGCTEITLLIKQEDVAIPLFDTTFIHAWRAVEFALKEK
ncbi:MAG: aspartate/glutamate racemase family protein [Firmicutes bacterium]|nr:aspartate/glutamate racemase family protein [Bacillota bacterium]